MYRERIRYPTACGSTTRWRIFSWFGRNRRLAKEWENPAALFQIFITLAVIQIAVIRTAL
jgi:hypothetical protein